MKFSGVSEEKSEIPPKTSPSKRVIVPRKLSSRILSFKTAPSFDLYFGYGKSRKCLESSVRIFRRTGIGDKRSDMPEVSAVPKIDIEESSESPEFESTVKSKDEIAGSVPLSKAELREVPAVPEFTAEESDWNCGGGFSEISIFTSEKMRRFKKRVLQSAIYTSSSSFEEKVFSVSIKTSFRKNFS